VISTVTTLLTGKHLENHNLLVTNLKQDVQKWNQHVGNDGVAGV
jgi:hypothetical protein